MFEAISRGRVGQSPSNKILNSSTVQTGNGAQEKIELARSIVKEPTTVPLADTKTNADRAATIHCFHDKNAFVVETLFRYD